jgi:hypothetical protein
VAHERRFSAAPPIGSGSNPFGLRLFGRGQGNRQFFQGAAVTHGRLGCRSPRRYRKRTRIYRPGADAGTAYEPVAGFDPTALEGSRASPHSARRWLFGNLLQYWYQPIFLLLSCFSVRPNARHVWPPRSRQSCSNPIPCDAVKTSSGIHSQKSVTLSLSVTCSYRSAARARSV